MLQAGGRIEAPGIGGDSAKRRYGPVRGGWTTVMSGPEGTGDKVPWKKRVGKAKTAGHGWRPSSPKAKVPQLPCPRLRGMGRGEGSMEIKRPYTHEKPICDGVPLIAMPGCP